MRLRIREEVLDQAMVNGDRQHGAHERLGIPGAEAPVALPGHDVLAQELMERGEVAVAVLARVRGLGHLQEARALLAVPRHVAAGQVVEVLVPELDGRLAVELASRGADT